MPRTGLIAFLGALLIALAALGSGAASASADPVLFERAVGPSGVAVPSNETPDGSERSEAFGEFVVPPGAHWRLSAVEAFGTTAVPGARDFNVTILRTEGLPAPVPLSDLQVFRAHHVPGTIGPSYIIPLEGVPTLEPGSYWIGVQAVSAGGEDNWSWLAAAEPGQAFKLFGTPTQILMVDGGNFGRIVSSPAGIDCAGICEAEFPRGTMLTLTGTSFTPAVELSGWHAIKPSIALPYCAAAGPCNLTLDQDLYLGADFTYVNRVTILRVVRDRRTGRGKLVVWLPGEGLLSMWSPGLRKFLAPDPLPAGLTRIPLLPRGQVATRLRRKGSAGVSAAISFRPEHGLNRATIMRHLTLVRRHPAKPRIGVH
jgi:hypothetical protein